MTQKELHTQLGELFTKLKNNLDENKYNEKVIETARTMAGVAKQMIQSADVSIRASKILNNTDILKEVFVENE